MSGSSEQQRRRRNGDNEENEEDNGNQQQNNGERERERERNQPPLPTGENDYMELFRQIGMRTGGFNANSGDYVSDDNLSDVINRLMLANPGPRGKPPAAPYHVEQLEEVQIDRSNKSKIGDCSICNDEFELNSEALRLPCKHVFHHPCIQQWLKMHNTCPLCREELPTLDLEYELSKYEEKKAKEDEEGRRELYDAMYI